MYRSLFQVLFLGSCSRFAFLLTFLVQGSAFAEVTKVTIGARARWRMARRSGAQGPYEKLIGTDRVRARSVRSPQQGDRRPRTRRKGSGRQGSFHSRPVRPAARRPGKGNGVLLFEISNRGTKGLLGRFNRAPASNDPTTAAHMGDGFLMREGYTLVWVGWQFDVAPPNLRIEAPAVRRSRPGHGDDDPERRPERRHVERPAGRVRARRSERPDRNPHGPQSVSREGRAAAALHPGASAHPPTTDVPA